jgi:small ligand-binding sensory domain FIST
MHAFIAFYGDVNPKFSITTAFAFEEGMSKVSTITKSEGPVLKAVDGMNAVEFLKHQGLLNLDGTVINSSVWAVPAVLTYPGGVKIARAFLGMDPATGYVFAGGYLPEGASVTFATLDSGKTLSSAAKLFDEINEAKRNDTIAFSCAARLWALGAGFGDEAEKIAESVNAYEARSGTALNYSLAYSGGEICPIKNASGEYVNALHNYTLIACSFN